MNEWGKGMALLSYPIEERTNWRWWVTPKPLQEKAIHRWFIFPHSFTGKLVHALIKEWALGSEDNLLDPFAGAGTTVLAAKECGVPCTGYDLSPLAVLVTRAKIAKYDITLLKKSYETLKSAIDPSHWNGNLSRPYPDLVQKALPGKLLSAFDNIDGEINRLHCQDEEKTFFRLALLSIIPQYSRAIPTGGWLKWIDKGMDVATLLDVLTEKITTMLKDLEEVNLPAGDLWKMDIADARHLPDHPNTYSAVITSPPYPNRHDYTRVFGVELMFGLLNWKETRQLRYQSFHSHPEAHPDRPSAEEYCKPRQLTAILDEVSGESDRRIVRMLDGYFLDMYLCLREVARVCKKGAKIAFVVGNAQYNNVPVPVDELTAEIGEQIGLTCEKLIAVRYRGNSAQQMGKFGRRPSRESVVVFSHAKVTQAHKKS